MLIPLNPELTFIESSWRMRTQEQLERTIKWQADIASEKKTLGVVRSLHSSPTDIYQPGYLDMVSRAYSQHYNLEVAPHDLWYIVLTQLADVINTNADKCRSLFTNSDKKVEILVGQDHATDINIAAIIDQMTLLVPTDIDLFLPDLTTHTEQSRLAHMAAFADAVKQYYDYGMFCCGIPNINLTGTPEDWTALHDNATELAALFSLVNVPKAVTYLTSIADVFKSICQSFTDGTSNRGFWLDIFTQQNVGSGGDLRINGWITKLYINNKPGDMIKSFHHTMSLLPYKNVSTKESFVMAHGAFRASVTSDGILYAQYDHVTLQCAE